MFDQTPNTFALIALAAWPVVAWLMVRAFGPAVGLLCAVAGGYLLLPPPPAGLDLPVLPPLTKDTIPPLAVALALWLNLGRLPPLWPSSRLAGLALAMSVLAPWVSVATNADPLQFGPLVLPGLAWREAAAASLFQSILMLPFLLARSLLAGELGARRMLWALTIAGLVYAIPMLAEVRLSPQINIWVYGFFQHLFEQMQRGDGYRPIVFLYHGLWAAFLMMSAVLATLTLMKGALAEGARTDAIRLGVAAAGLAVVVVLCKSSGSLVYMLVGGLMLLTLRPRWLIAFGLVCAVFALSYPLLRAWDLIPTQSLVDAIARVAPERANSLAFRFDNEARLLERALERPVAGWGLWGRNLIYDVTSGRVASIPDGRWIVILGTFGWFGFVAEMTLLSLPMWLLWRRGEQSPFVAGLVLIHGINLLDLLPNATATPMTWLVAGVLLGRVESQPEAAPARLEVEPILRPVIP